MKLLVVTPDYASHWYPLSAVAAAAARRGHEVVVATGPALRERVGADGFEWVELRTSGAGNAGSGASDDLSAFFAATRRGLAATLLQQANARCDDLLWRPEQVAADVRAVLARVAPDAVVADHLSLAATLGLRSAGVAFTTFVAGHPSQLPTGGERYGFPIAWPAAIDVSPDELDELRAACERATVAVTTAYGAALRALGDASDSPFTEPVTEPVADAFAVHGEDVLFNSASALHPPGRALPARHAFLGSCVRSERADAVTRRWLDEAGDEPFAHVSFGTFLSARDDVLARVVGALRQLGVRAAVATGAADRGVLGELPATWLVAPTLPQVTLLGRAGALVTHAGNGGVTEALAAACPIVALPFSSDQPAVAADLERTGHGRALDPNRASDADIADAVTWALEDPGVRRRVSALADELARSPGPDLAVERIVAVPARR